MALLPSVTQIPSQRVPFNERPQPPEYVSREWYRFLDSLHTYIPTPVTFVPTLTSVTNVTSVTAGTCFYNQMGTTITVTGSVTLDPAATGNTVFQMDPPVLDGLSISQAAGMFITTTAGPSDVGSVTVASDKLQFRLNAISAASAVYVFHVNYQIV
jgi:hypothetical protein